MSLPLVSIGVPVYNDEKWLRRSLDHLLQQDYHNIEIVIADDLSTDDSSKICREYAEKDPRIRFFQNKFNLGALGNHRFVFELSTGDYFAWGSGHDYFHPSFVSRCLEILEQDKSVIHCCYQTLIMGVDGSSKKTTPNIIDTRGLNPAQRYMKVMKGVVSNADIFYGLYRANALLQSNPYRNIFGGDLVFLAEISLLGATVQLDEVLHYRQLNRHESAEQAEERWINTIIQPRGFCLEAVAPWLVMASEFIKVIHCSSLSLSDKELLSGEVVTYCKKRFGGSIKRDIERLSKQVAKGFAEYGNYPTIKAQFAGEALSYINSAHIFFPTQQVLHDLRSACNNAMGIEKIKQNPIKKMLQRIADRIAYGVVPLIRRWLHLIKDRIT